MKNDTANTLNESDTSTHHDAQRGEYAGLQQPVGDRMKITEHTRAAGFHRAPRNGKDVFQVVPGMPPYQALAFAENALVVCVSLLCEIGNGNERDEDIAFAVRFLIEAAGGAYRAAGVVA